MYCLGSKERGGALKRGKLSKFQASQKRGLFARGLNRGFTVTTYVYFVLYFVLFLCSTGVEEYNLLLSTI